LNAVGIEDCNAGLVLASCQPHCRLLVDLRWCDRGDLRADASMLAWLRDCDDAVRRRARMHRTPHSIQTPNGGWVLAEVLWLVVGETSRRVHDTFSTVPLAGGPTSNSFEAFRVAHVYEVSRNTCPRTLIHAPPPLSSSLPSHPSTSPLNKGSLVFPLGTGLLIITYFIHTNTIHKSLY